MPLRRAGNISNMKHNLSGSWLWFAVALSLAGCAHTKPAVNTGDAAPIGPNTLNVADAAIAGGDPSMALSVTQSVLATDPGNPDALVHEGDAYYALGRCPAAEAAYQLALQHDAKATAAETGLGRCLLKTDPHAAEAAFVAAVRDDPGNADAWNDLGIARDLQGNFAGAVGPYQKSLLADPTMTGAEVNLGLSLALSGDGPQALQYLGPLATSQSATPKIREDYAAALLASGRASEARQVLAVDLPPDQVNSAMAGFSELIGQSQLPPPFMPPPPPTVTQVQTATVTEVPQPAPAAAPVPLVVPEAPPSAPPPVPAVAPPPPPQPPVSTTAPVGAGGSSVQLGALNTPDDAERAWRHISGAAPSLFNGREPEIQPVTVGTKTFYRLRVSGFDSRASAAKFCGEVLAAGNACTVANF